MQVRNMKVLGLILSLIVLTSLSSITLEYSKPYRESDYIMIYRKFGWQQTINGNSKPIDYKGIVIELKDNAPVLSIEDGIVIEICDTCSESKYGNYLTIKFGGSIIAKYYHLSILKVRKGQSIRKAEEIGISGKTGLATVNCVGIQIEKRGKIIDPMKIISEK
jgi:murein DD-endopeptidase MepM/ murein hydrolase activator NlpD